MYIPIAISRGDDVLLGQPPVALAFPRVTGRVFRNSGTTSSDNCCLHCPIALGVGIDFGAGPTASNGMELRFTITGHGAGFEYDITRTRRNSVWERRSGTWTRLQYFPMGTGDDRHDNDECLRLRHDRIFAIDTPGFPGVVLPRPHGMQLRLLSGALTHVDATDIVSRFSFAEWVIVRHRGEGIPWTRLELPPYRDGSPRRFVFWNNIIWLTRENPSDPGSRWILDRVRSRIALGALLAAIINSAPV